MGSVGESGPGRPAGPAFRLLREQDHQKKRQEQGADQDERQDAVDPRRATQLAAASPYPHQVGLNSSQALTATLRHRLNYCTVAEVAFVQVVNEIILSPPVLDSPRGEDRCALTSRGWRRSAPTFGAAVVWRSVGTVMRAP